MLLGSELPQCFNPFLDGCVSKHGEIEESGAPAGGVRVVARLACVSAQRRRLDVLVAGVTALVLTWTKVEAAKGKHG